MEVKGGKDHKVLVFIYECLGTAMLMTGINLSSTIGGLKPIGIALTLYSAILIFGGPGGAHYNPAVTIGVFIKEGKISHTPVALIMIAAQIVGAFLAEILLYICFSFYALEGEHNPATLGFNILCPDGDGNTCTPLSVGQFFWTEMWATWVLVAVILTVKYHYESEESTLGPLTVALTLLTAISWSAGTTGGCLNPAVGIANSFFQYAIRNKFVMGAELTLDSLWVYIIAPSMGGALAGLF